MVERFGSMARLPADWPDPPKRMSFSALTDIKGSHLRWVLLGHRIMGCGCAMAIQVN